MPKFFVNEEQIQKEDVKVIGNDVKHIKNVLREKRVNNMQYFK
jgi:16S rRNA U1498 N3-methylase RsmE